MKLVLVPLGVLFASALAAAPPQPQSKTLTIPRVEHPPALDDFLGMKPGRDLEGKLAKVEAFVQREPKDGEPASQRTEVYLGYDQKNFYAIFVCFDSEPDKIRAHMNRRENLEGEEQVQLYLDTFHDQRRAYVFGTNPLGIQQDFIWTESQGYDTSFDTIWQSQGKRTAAGFIVWMAIPFKSLRFPSISQQTWGILLQRVIPRSSETDFWPRVSARIEGHLNQEGTLTGLGGISPGRNIQFIPYGVFRSFRELDLRDPAAPRFSSKTAGGDVGLDAKLVFHDSFVLDATINPDFSQVESDEPQVTVNQRFEVFFPEKRPFFLENSDFFQTALQVPELGFYQPPIKLVFTRRIVNPEFGLRLTGKRGPYSVGLLVSDDRSPGKTVPVTDPLFDKRAYFGIVRLNRDIGSQSSVGLLYTDRELLGTFNRVGGFDGRFRLNQNWVATGQATLSSTQDLDGTYSFGTAYDAQIQRTGRKFNYDLEYHDTSPGFITQTGFFRRPDIRRLLQGAEYRFRPEGKHLISWGPVVILGRSYDYSGDRLDELYLSGLNLEWKGQTAIAILAGTERDTLRPKDFSALPSNRDYSQNFRGAGGQLGFTRQLIVSAFFLRGGAINFDPPTGQAPFLANQDFANLKVTLRPITALSIENTYFLNRLRDRAAGAAIFNNHILRTKWNYQVNRELSFRFIGQYAAVLANPQLTSLQTTKNFNADFLITYLLHPGTALYVGYNSNLQNIDPSLSLDADGNLLRTRDRFINDSRQFFVKLSYVFRY